MKRWEKIEIARRLMEETLFLYVLSGIGFFVAEAILPGIFSQRIDFFFLYAGFIVLSLGVITFGKLSQKDPSENENGDGVIGRKWSVRKSILVVIMCALFLLPIIKNVGPFMLPLMVFCSAIAITLLVRNLSVRGKSSCQK